MVFLPHTNTVILLEPYCGTITEPGLPVDTFSALIRDVQKISRNATKLWVDFVTVCFPCNISRSNCQLISLVHHLKQTFVGRSISLVKK